MAIFNAVSAFKNDIQTFTNIVTTNQNASKISIYDLNKFLLFLLLYGFS